MSTSRGRQQQRSSGSRSSPASRSTRSSRQTSLRQPTDALLAEIQQRTNTATQDFPSNPALVFGPSETATHAHLSGPISHALSEQQLKEQSASKQKAQLPSSVGKQKEQQAPAASLTSIHSPGHFDRMEYQDRERMMQAARILGNRELLMRYAILNNESVPQTRLRLQKQLVGVKHVPYTSATTTSMGSSSSSAGKGKETSVLRDMRPDEDDEKGTWAEGEVVVGPGPLVQAAKSSEG